MSSGSFSGIAEGIPGTQCTLEQGNLERKVRKNEERIKFLIGNQYQFFIPVQFDGTVYVNGKKMDVSRKVYQRQDIDFHYVDFESGLSNLDRMKKGRRAYG